MLIMETVFLAAVAWIDLQKMYIPRELPIIFGCGCAVVQLMWGKQTVFWWLAACAPGIIVFVTAAVTRESVGYGDAWTILACGPAAGGGRIAASLVAALLFASGYGAYIIMKRRPNRAIVIPFLPFLLAGHLCITVMFSSG